jgi:threonine dehydrogenase-like Zn-dependent dehydrogenase
VGDGVIDVRVGDGVWWYSHQSLTGRGWFCQRGLHNACDGTNRSALMEKRYGTTTGGILGYFAGQAEYIASSGRPQAEPRTVDDDGGRDE